MSTEDVQVRLSAQGTADVIAAFRKVQEAAAAAKRKMEQDAQGLSGVFAGLSSQLMNMVKVFTVGFIIRELAMVAKEALNTAAEVGRLAENVGYSTETISVFNFALQRNGRTLDQGAAGLRIFGKHMQEVDAHTGLASAAIGKLFGNLDALKGLKTEEAFKKVITAVSQTGTEFNRTAVLQNLFGRSGDNLAVVFNDMARNGGEMAEKLRSMGLLLSNETTDGARAAYAALTEMKTVMLGMATETVSGFSTTIVQLNASLEELVSQLNGGTSAFKTFGEAIGLEIKGMMILVIAQITVWRLEQAYLTFVVKESVLALLGYADVLGKLISLDFSGAIKDGKAYFKEMENSAMKFGYNLGVIELKAELALSALYDPPVAKKKPAALGGSGGGDDGGGGGHSSTTARAQAEADLSALESRHKDQIAAQKLLNARLKVQYEEGENNQLDYFASRATNLKDSLIQEQKYYDGKIAIQKRVNAADILALQERKIAVSEKVAAPANTAGTAINAQEVIKLNDEIASKERQGQAKINALIADRARLGTKYNEDKLGQLHEEFISERDSAHAITQLKKELAKVEGDAYVVEMEEADRKVLEYIKRTHLAANDPLVNKFRDTLGGNADINRGFANYDKTLKELKLKHEEIALEVQAGKIFPATGAAREKSITAEYLAKLKKEIDAIEAANLQRPDQIARLNQLKIAYSKLAISTDDSALSMAQFKKNAQNAATGDILNFFNAAIDGSRNMGQAFRDMAISIVKDLAKIAIQTEITGLIMKAFGLLGTASLSGTTVSTTPIDTSGFHYAPGRADGGIISGPGTGTSDSVPIWASHGEYVVNARAAQSNLGLLNALNFGSHVPNFSRPRFNFADGGMVAGGGGGSSTTLAVFNDPAQFTRFLKSPEGQDAIVHVVSENPNQIRRIINS